MAFETRTDWPGSRKAKSLAGSTIWLFASAILWMAPVSAQVNAPDLTTLKAECANVSGTGSPQVVMGACMKLTTMCGIPCITPDERGIKIVISGLAWGSHVWIKVSGGPTLMSGGNGSISVPVPSSRYAVSVVSQPPGQSCAVENGTGTAAGNPWTRVILKCGGEHSIGGVVSGLSLGEHLLLVNHGQDYLTVSNNGKYQFDAQMKPGDEYAVGIAKSPPAKQCTISGKVEGIVGIVDITDLVITCVALPPPNGLVIGVEDADLAGVPKAVADAVGGQTDECTVAGKYMRTQLGATLWFVANSCGGSGGQPMDLVLATQTGAKEVLSEFGLGMTIKYVTTNGMPDIVVQHGGPRPLESYEYRFNGSAYMPVSVRASN